MGGVVREARRQRHVAGEGADGRVCGCAAPSEVRLCNVAQLGALAKLAREKGGFDDLASLLKARKRMQKDLEKAYEAGKVAEEEVLDGVIALGGS